MLSFHPHNLGSRHRCELAYSNRLGVDLTTMNSVAEVLCHTETVPEDLLYSDRSRRMLTLLHGRYVETSDGHLIRTAAQIQPHSRFRLTEKGREALQRAAATPYVAVGETISSSLQDDKGISPDHRKSFQQILDAETADRRIRHRYGQRRSSTPQDNQIDWQRERLEHLLRN